MDQNSTNANIQSLAARVSGMEAKSETNLSMRENPSTTQVLRYGIPYSSFKLDVTCFDGSDPLIWTFTINVFCNYHQTPEEQRITIALFYMDEPNLSWFLNGCITTGKLHLD